MNMAKFRNLALGLSVAMATPVFAQGAAPATPAGPTPNDSVAMVDGAGHEVGPAILLKVMS